MKVVKAKLKPEILLQKIVFGLFTIGIICLIAFAGISILFLRPVDASSETTVKFTVQEGWSKSDIAKKLEEAQLIRSEFFFKFYMKVNDKEMYAGTYELSRSMSVDEIIKTLNSANSAENETITVTFIEGKRLTDYAKKISANFAYTEEEVLAKLADEVYLRTLIEKYWFVTESILAKDIYYPLEGYLFPDTYIIKKSATIEEIVDKLLSTMDSKLSIYKEEITLSNLNIHEILTLASIVELEGANSNDRSGVAGVFYNRLKTGMTLGSDVTTYYAVKKDFSVDLTYKDLSACNAYNTRGTCVPGLPVGPIASAGLSSINATVEPATHDFYYFVADKEKKTYFSKDGAEHARTVAKLKQEGKWYEY